MSLFEVRGGRLTVSSLPLFCVDVHPLLVELKSPYQTATLKPLFKSAPTDLRSTSSERVRKGKSRRV